MKYLLLKYEHDDNVFIVNDDANYVAGYIKPLKFDVHGSRFCVQNSDGEEIAVVRSIDDAIPALAVYYEKNRRNGNSKAQHATSKWISLGGCE